MIARLRLREYAHLHVVARDSGTRPSALLGMEAGSFEALAFDESLYFYHQGREAFQRAAEERARLIERKQEQARAENKKHRPKRGR